MNYSSHNASVILFPFVHDFKCLRGGMQRDSLSLCFSMRGVAMVSAVFQRYNGMFVI